MLRPVPTSLMGMGSGQLYPMPRCQQDSDTITMLAEEASCRGGHVLGVWQATLLPFKLSEGLQRALACHKTTPD